MVYSARLIVVGTSTHLMGSLVIPEASIPLLSHDLASSPKSGCSAGDFTAQRINLPYSRSVELLGI